MDAGDIANWVSGLATLAAVAVALYFSLRAESRESEALTSSLYAWAQYDDADGIDSSSWRLVVSNMTDAPIYQWQVTLTWVAGDGTESSDEISSELAGLVVPGRQEYLWAPPIRPKNDALVRPTLTFTNARGVTCRRDATGRITRLRRGRD